MEVYETQLARERTMEIAENEGIPRILALC